MIKRILIIIFTNGLPKKAIQAAKKTCFGMKERYLLPSSRRTLLRPSLPVQKFFYYTPFVGIIFHLAWLTVVDHPV